MMANKIGKCDFKNELFMEDISNIKSAVEDVIYVDDKKFLPEIILPTERTELTTEICKNMINGNVISEIDTATNIETEIKKEESYCIACQQYYHNHCTKCEMLGHIMNTNVIHSKRVDVKKGSNKCKKVHPQVYKCKHCKYKSIYKGDLKNHTNKHYQVKAYVCGTCRRRFKKKQSLILHMRNVHINVEGEVTQEDSTCEDVNSLWNNGQEFDSSRLKMEATDSLQIQECGMVGHDIETVHKCSYCKYQTTYTSSLRRHMRTQHLKVTNDYKCGACNYETHYEPYLKRHVRTKHAVEATFACGECEFRTNYKPNLRAHVKVVHMKETNYECTHCDYKTNNRSNLKVHVKRKHLEDKYECVQCAYRTKCEANLKAHVKMRHLKGQYKCAECKYQTCYESRLKRHVNTTHSTETNCYKCENCEYTTNNGTYLEAHVKAKHFKEFNYKCTLCEY